MEYRILTPPPRRRTPWVVAAVLVVAAVAVAVGAYLVGRGHPSAPATPPRRRRHGRRGPGGAHPGRWSPPRRRTVPPTAPARRGGDRHALPAPLAGVTGRPDVRPAGRGDVAPCRARRPHLRRRRALRPDRRRDADRARGHCRACAAPRGATLAVPVDRAVRRGPGQYRAAAAAAGRAELPAALVHARRTRQHCLPSQAATAQAGVVRLAVVRPATRLHLAVDRGRREPPSPRVPSCRSSARPPAWRSTGSPAPRCGPRSSATWRRTGSTRRALRRRPRVQAGAGDRSPCTRTAPPGDVRGGCQHGGTGGGHGRRDLPGVRARDRFADAGDQPDGITYDDPDVPWASYFNGGDALHGFVRTSYGTPQSNGCVEMPVAVAAQVWPLTPVGTPVTVTGPPS